MNTTEQEREALIRIFEQVPLNEDSFVWFILNTYLHCQSPDFPVLELGNTQEMLNVKIALKDLFSLVEPFDWNEI
jgi:hypothetical protein